MKNIQNSRIYWVFFSLILLGYISLRFYGQPLVEYLFNNNHIDILDKICNNSGAMPLDYYKGKVENVILGPLKSVLSGSLLLSFCYIYGFRFSPLKFFLTIFAYFVISRGEIILEPPYGEAFTGPFIDATWLYRHSLNYFDLYRQGSHIQGGPHVYPTSLFPLALAALMKLIPNRIVCFAVMHLAVFVFTAVILAIMRKVLERVFEPKRAVLAALLLLALPTFQSMLEMINMEMACLFFCMLCVHFLLEKRFVPAAFFALGANFVKDPGVIACLSVFIISVLIYAERPRDKNSKKALLCGIIVLISSVIKFKVRLAVIQSQSHFNMVSPLSGLKYMSESPWAMAFCITVIVFLVGALMRLVKNRSEKGKYSLFLEQHYSILIMYVMAAMWYLIYLNFSAMHHRYSLLLSPFLVSIVLYALLLVMAWPVRVKIAWGVLLIYLFYGQASFSFGIMLALAILIFFVIAGAKIFNFGLQALVVFLFFCSYGFLYPQDCNYQLTYNNTCQNDYFAKECYTVKNYEPIISHCNPSELERSLEYRNYLQLQKKIVREMKKYSDFLIVAPAIGAAETMFFPEMGYIDKPLNVEGYGGTVNLGLPNYRGLKRADIMKTVYLGFRYDRIFPQREYPVTSKDKILEYITYGDIQAVVFMGGVGIEEMRRFVILHSITTKQKKQEADISP
ncbi:MAG: hypothetical protein HQL27_01190 [Candidatus Omnitrophica bacterium]|nr:hypothetical protein [Candidatus Omnitrophota bacterium]